MDGNRNIAGGPVGPSPAGPRPVDIGAITRHALVAEDDEVSQLVATRMLEKRGFKVDVVTDGRQAIQAAEVRAYDLVLMDGQMPVMDGYAATRELRRKEQDRRTPVIAVTADGHLNHCLAAGMDDCIRKPLTFKALDAILARWAPAAPS